MNQEANEVRVKSTLGIIDHLVSRGYTFFSSVYLHTEFNEAVPKYRGLEVWSDSLFFTVPDKAFVLRISLNYREGVDATVGRMNLSFQLLAEARSLHELNEQAQSDNLEQEVVHVQANVGYPKLPRFIELGSVSRFPNLSWTNYFTENPDRWVRQIQGSRPSVALLKFDPLVMATALDTWIQPMIPYVKSGRIMIPDRCGVTRDLRFVESEKCMRERLNLRTFREIAEFGKFL
jgi:hypothetical protein